MRTGVALAAIGAVAAFVAHGLLQVLGIALVVVALTGLWLARRPGWTQHRAQAIGSWLTAPEDEQPDGPRVPLEDILYAPPAACGHEGPGDEAPGPEPGRD